MNKGLNIAINFFLSLTLALGLASIVFLSLLPIYPRNIVAQVSMWSIPWVWLSVYFTSFYFKKSWQYLLGLTLLIGMCVFWMKQ